MNIAYRTFLIVFSSVLIALAIPNEFFYYGSGILGLVALVPLYCAFDKPASWVFAGYMGGLMMFIVHLLSSFWLAYFKEFAIFTLGGSALATFVMGIPVGWAIKLVLSHDSRYRPILFASVWTLWEWFKSIGFLAYPWGTLHMSMYRLKTLPQIVDITGVWGLSFSISLCSALIAEIIRTLPKKNWHSIQKKLVTIVAVLFLLHSYGIVRLAFLPEKIDSAHLLLVQQNEDSWESGDILGSLVVSQDLTRTALDNQKDTCDLVVWSESILPYTFNNNSFWYSKNPINDPFIPFLQDIKTPLLTGSPYLVNEENLAMANAVIYFDALGNFNSWYAKMQLVPFAEYMPLTEYEIVRTFFDALIGFSSGWQPGTDRTTMDLTLSSGRTISFISPICFEDAFPALVASLKREGADLIVNVTNDSWSKTNSAEIQHSALASFRAIELRCPMVRATNAGHTVVYDQSGKNIADIPLFVSDVLSVSVPIYPRSLTLYTRLGDWFPKSLLVMLLIVALQSNRITKNVGLGEHKE